MREILKCLIPLLLLSSSCTAQLPEFDRTIRTEKGCQVTRSSHELKAITRLPDSMLCKLSGERIYYKYVERRGNDDCYDLIYSVDSLVNGSKAYLEIIDCRNGELYYVGEFGAFLPRYYQSYSQDYINGLSFKIKKEYGYYGFYPLREVKYSNEMLIFYIEAFNGLGYRFEYRVNKKGAVCEKTNLAQFSEFYDKRAPVPRDLFVGSKLSAFNYPGFYEYFETTEDL